MNLQQIPKIFGKDKIKLANLMTDSGTSVFVDFDGPKTRVSVILEDDIFGMGTAKCMSIDKYSQEIGFQIATARALQDAMQKIEAVWLNRVQPLEEWNNKHYKG